MDTMQHMDMAGAYMAPAWLVYTLSAGFFAGALFYLFRLVRPATVKSAYGYHDWQNEAGHGICMLAMAASMAPAALQLPSTFWAVTLSASAAFFLARAVSWGRHLPYPTKWWWDWAHVGMLAGMALMFIPVSLGAFNYVLEAFWLWFAGYYAYSLIHDLGQPKALHLGSDFSHLSMGVVMLIMTAAPMALMPPGGQMSMPGMICSPKAHSQTSQPAPAQAKDPGCGMDMPGMDMCGHGDQNSAGDPAKH